MGNRLAQSSRKVQPSGGRSFLSMMSLSRRTEAVNNLAYSVEEQRLMQLYLADFRFTFKLTSMQQEVIATHWQLLFPDHETRHSTRTDDYQHHPFAKLYRAFYDEIDFRCPELAQVFGKSMDQRTRVLAHLTAGMYPLLHAPPQALAEYMTRITTTHARVGVQLHHFNALGLALLHALAEFSGPENWSQEVETAWCCMFCQCSLLLLAQQLAFAKTETTQVMAFSPVDAQEEDGTTRAPSTATVSPKAMFFPSLRF